MARVPAPPQIPGIAAFFKFRPETGVPLCQLAEALLRGPSPLSSGERELIAATVSAGNECVFCSRSHAAAAAAHLGGDEATEAFVEQVRTDPMHAPLSDKMKALLTIALQVRESGKAVTDDAVNKARALGVTDVELHDTVLIAAAFCMFNRYVDGLQALTPDDPAVYREMGKAMAFQGYMRKRD
jgi:uncharacterized peroxidase-related enzyme